MLKDGPEETHSLTLAGKHKDQTGLNCCTMGGLKSQFLLFPLSLPSTKEGKNYMKDN